MQIRDSVRNLNILIHLRKLNISYTWRIQLRDLFQIESYSPNEKTLQPKWLILQIQ